MFAPATDNREIEFGYSKWATSMSSGRTNSETTPHAEPLRFQGTGAAVGSPVVASPINDSSIDEYGAILTNASDGGTTKHGSHRAPLPFRWWMSQFPRVAGVAVGIAGLLAIVGWIAGVPPLRAEIAGVTPIPLATAVFFLCGGLALWFRARKSAAGMERKLGLVFAGMLAIWGSLFAIDYSLAAIVGVHDPAIARLTSIFRTPDAERVSVWSALVFGVLGFAPLFLNTRRLHWLAELLIVVPLSVSFLGLVSEAFRVIALSGPLHDRPSALPNALTLFVLELGLLFSRRDRGSMAILTGKSLGGSMARWLLPFAVLVPFGMAWLRMVAEQAKLISPDVGGALYALLIVFVQSLLILVYAAAANRTDRQRKDAEAFVRSLYRVGARLNSTLDVDQLLSILVTEAIRIARAESGMAGLRSREGMVCRQYIRRGESIPFYHCWSIGNGLAGRAAERKGPFRTNDRDALVDDRLHTRFAVRSALSVPILDSRGEAMGFFEVHNKIGGSFTETDERHLAAVAQAAASAIQNALAYRHLHEAEQALQAADRHKNEFLATLAHELRNPLAPLRNGLQIIRLRGGDDSDVNSARAMMERQLGHMVRLVDDLLDVSRISRGKIELRNTPVLLTAIVQQAVETSRPAMERAGHQLSIHVPSEPIILNADLTRMTQVFANLLNNAAKFTEPGGHIALTAERHGSEVEVRVRDNGVGISAEMLDKVFDVFTQADPSLDRSQGGLGIGLSLVRGLVELHGGTVEARSEGRGAGSEFVVRLPVPLAIPGDQPAGSAQDRPTVRRRILVVDDNRDSAISLAMMLDIMGNETRTAHDGLEALNIGAAFQPDVVLLDIGMPKLNGYEAARRIRSESWGRGALLVAVTGWGQEEDRLRSHEAGFDHHAVKPIEPAVLLRLLNAFESEATAVGPSYKRADNGAGSQQLETNGSI